MFRAYNLGIVGASCLQAALGIRHWPSFPTPPQPGAGLKCCLEEIGWQLFLEDDADGEDNADTGEIKNVHVLLQIEKVCSGELCSS